MSDYDESKAHFEKALRPLLDEAFQHVAKLGDKTTRGDMAKGGREILEAFVLVDALIAAAENIGAVLRDTDPDFAAGYAAATRTLTRQDAD